MKGKPPKPPARGSDTHDALLGDLESLRTLLDASDRPLSDDEVAPPSLDDAEDVPVLDDMVEGAFTVDERTLTSRASIDDGAARSDAADSDAPIKTGLGDDTIQALLGDTWRTEARKILANARSTLEGVGGWSTSELNALNESLKVRIDRTLDDWLVEMMNARIDDLRSRLLTILENELEQFTRAVTDREQHGE